MRRSKGSIPSADSYTETSADSSTEPGPKSDLSRRDVLVGGAALLVAGVVPLTATADSLKDRKSVV